MGTYHSGVTCGSPFVNSLPLFRIFLLPIGYGSFALPIFLDLVLIT
jgi:hypothetical protein